jgi:hypothetical protein
LGLYISGFKSLHISSSIVGTMPDISSNYER